MKYSCVLVCVFWILIGGSFRATASADRSAKTLSKLNALTNASPSRIKAFFDSKDYKKLNRTDAEFIADVYHIVLQRDPDTSGYNGWLETMKRMGNDPKARVKAVDAFFQSSEYAEKQRIAAARKVKKKDTTRLSSNVLFNKTGMFINSADAFPPDRYIPLMKKGAVTWIALQIDNGGQIRKDNAEAIEKGWMDKWHKAGFKVGFWGAARGAIRHNDPNCISESSEHVRTDAALAVSLTAKYHGDFYLADCEDGYQGYSPTDPAPALNRVYVDAFDAAAKAAGLAKLPRALSSMGRIALDMKPWIDAGWDALPQAYWNSYSHYQPSKCVDFFVETGWPVQRIHPTIATFTSEGEKRTVPLTDYAADLKTRPTTGFSFYLPESYLGLKNDAGYEQIARMGRK